MKQKVLALLLVAIMTLSACAAAGVAAAQTKPTVSMAQVATDAASANVQPTAGQANPLSSVPGTAWQGALSGSTSRAAAYSVQMTSYGEYIVAGVVTNANGINQALLIKTDVSGNREWQRTFSGIGQAVAYSVQQTKDGGYIVAGYTWNNRNLALLIKTNAAGGLTWQRTFSGIGQAWAYSAQQTKDGGYVMAGVTWNSTGINQALLIKTNAAGGSTWQRTFSGPLKYTYASSVQQTKDGGYIVAGWTQNSTSVLALLLKTDASGNRQWQRTFSGPLKYTHASSVQQTKDGGYIVAGWTQNSTSVLALLLKTNAAGGLTWQRTFSGIGQAGAYSTQQTKDGGYIVAGASWNSTGVNQALLLKTDASGNRQWQRTFSGIGQAAAHSVQQWSDGGYIVAGPTWNSTNNQALLLKTDASGNRQWQQTYA